MLYKVKAAKIKKFKKAETLSQKTVFYKVKAASKKILQYFAGERPAQEVHMNEEIMIKKLKEQDSEALDEAIRQYTRLVSAIICNLAGSQLSKEDVEELTEDTFIAMWYNADKLEVGKLKAYICQIAKNKTKNRLRDMNKHSKVVSIENMTLEDDFLLTDDIEEKHASMSLLEAINEIGEPDREIILRRYYYYQNSKQIGQIMKMNDATVRTKLSRAKDKLKKILKERGFAV